MAVIQIPSKNIFSIDNPKILDNIIDKIEINTNNAKIIVDKDGLSYTETVDTQINNGEKYVDTQGASIYSANKRGGSRETGLSADAQNSIVQLRAYSEMRLGYLTIPIKVYKNTYSDRYITDIYYGTDQTDTPNIEYTSEWLSFSYYVNGEYYYINSDKSLSQADTVYFTRGSLIGSPITKEGKILLDKLTNSADNQVTFGKNEEDKDDENDYVKYHYHFEQEFVPSGYSALKVKLSATNDIKIEDKTDTNQRYSKGTDENGDYFAFNLTVLCSRQITTMINDNYQIAYDRVGLIPNPSPMNGVTYCDITQNVSFTFHGETIQLDIGELLKYVGKENGTNVFSVDTNELVQSSNTPLLEKYEKILEAYKNGKEIATIRCSIDDYYTDYYGDRKDKAICIELTPKSIYETVTGTATGMLLINATGSFFVGVGKIKNLQIRTIVGGNSRVSYDEDTGEISWTINGTRNQIVRAIITGTLELQSHLPMSFHLHDKVIPYIYNAKGVDVPMSQYKDGTPKVFEVLSSKVYYDGAVWQELVLVESKDNID